MDTILHKGENCFFAPGLCQTDDTGRTFSEMGADFKASNFEAGADSGVASAGAARRGNMYGSARANGKTVQTMKFINPIYLIGRGTIVGSKEGKGPLGKYFDNVAEDAKMGTKTFEQAEVKMLESAIMSAIKSSGKKVNEMELMLCGDLLNQITSSSFVARDLGIPFIGLYSACSTMTSSLALAASMIDAGFYNNVVCATSSHFATAERQYRYPLEYGCQRPPYAQWTVTGAGASVLSSSGSGPRITLATLGRVVDYGINDLNNMGAAMAPVNAIIPLLTRFCISP